MNAHPLPFLKDIQDACSRISPFIHRTPVMTSSQLNSIFKSDLHFKCENFQKVGAFKFRGATNAIMQLPDKERSRGVITHSSGNHAAALSLAAKEAGIKAYIVMPSSAPDVKKAAVAAYGAEISFCEPTLAARISTAQGIIEKTGASFIHPYDNFNVICGQGTVALEMMKDIDNLDIVVCPVGGGGLLSGTATAVKGLNPGVKVIAAEPLGADDASRSFYSGELVRDHSPLTIADGLLTTLSERTFSIIRDKVDDIFTVDEDAIIKGMKLIWERMKLIVEPSSATVLAAIMNNPDVFYGKRVGLILSGGNIDLRKLPF
jgi:threonine dehydratase